MPVSRQSPVNTTPTSAEAPARRSQNSVRFQRYMALPTAVTPNAR